MMKVFNSSFEDGELARLSMVKLWEKANFSGNRDQSQGMFVGEPCAISA
jgi:hypothetical protein